MNEHCSWSYGH